MNLLLESQWLFIALVGGIGLLFGSFFNVVIYRLPIMLKRDWQQQYFASIEQEPPAEPRFDLFLPASRCPNCQHVIKYYENIPVGSWLFLKGCCSQCDNPISMRYPLVELATALLSMLVAAYFGVSSATFFALIFSWALLILALIDIDQLLLPDSLTQPLLWLGLLVSLNGTFIDLQASVIGAIAGYSVLFITVFMFKLITGKNGMGKGDFKLLAALGAWLGWQSLPLVLIIAVLVTLCLSIVYTFSNKAKPLLPFGPGLAIAGGICLFYSNAINSWLLNF